MKFLILYPDQYAYSALTIQATLLERGLKELSHEAKSLCTDFKFSKELEYRAFNPDVVIGVGFWGNIPELINNPLNHGQIAVPWLNANGWVANYHDTLNSLPLILVTSGWVKKVYERDGIKPDNIRPAHVAIDTEIFKPLSKENLHVAKIRDALGIKEKDLVILTAGGDATSKGAQEMFKAIAKNKEKMPNLRYVCKTWPSENTNEWRQREMHLLDDLGIKDKVIFHDEVLPHTYMPYLLNACDIYAGPSRLEGFGMIQVEAMACGKPVISINSMGPAETILHGETGFLAEVEQEIKLDKEWVGPDMGFEKVMQIEFPNPKTFAYRANTNQLADFLLKLYQDPELRATMGKAAEKHAKENFNPKKIAQNIVKIINQKIFKSQS